MSSVTLSMLLTARDDASGVFRRVGAAAGAVDKSHGRLARSATVAKAALLGLGTAAVGAAAYFAVDSVKAYAAAEKAQLALQDAYAKYPKLAGATTTAIRGLNTALQTKTRFDDDDLAMMQSRLAAFRLTDTQLRTLTPLIADYAAKTGQDVVSSGTAIGKALLGNTRALKAVGISYTSTGNKAKDFANIVARLRNHVGGFAEAEGRTAAGKLAILDNQFEELKETVGSALMPYLTDLVDWMTSNMPQIQSAVRSAMPGVRQAFTTVAAAAKTVGGVLKGMFDAFQALPGPVKNAAAALAAVGLAMKGLKATGILTGGKLAIDIGSKMLGKGTPGGLGGCCCGPGGRPGGPAAPATKGPGPLGMAPAAAAGWLAAFSGASVGVDALNHKLEDTFGVSTRVTGVFADIARQGGSPFSLVTAGARQLGIQLQNIPSDPFVNLGLDEFVDRINAGEGDMKTFADAINAGVKPADAFAQALAAASPAAVATKKLAGATQAYGTILRQVSNRAGQTSAGIKGNTKAAAANRAALAGQAGAAKNLIGAMRTAGATDQAVTAKQRQLGAAFVRTAKSMGASRKDAVALAKSLGLIPKSKNTKVAAPGAKDSKRDIDRHNASAGKVPKGKSTKVDAPGATASKSMLDNVTRAAQNIPRSVPISVSQSGGESVVDTLMNVANAAANIIRDVYVNVHYLQSGKPPGSAAGGRLSGPGTDTSDSLLIRASNDEYVVRARSARRIGYHRLDWMNQTGQLPHFAGGGKVGDVAPDTDRGYTRAELQEIVNAIKQGLHQHDAETKRRRQGRDEGDKAYERRMNRLDARRERLDAARQAKQAAQAAIDQRRAREEARQARERDKQREKEQREKERRDAVMAAYREKRAGMVEGLTRMQSFASVSGMDLSAAASAQEEARLARGAVGSAGSANDRRAALLTAKEADVKAARAKVTGASVRKWLTDKKNAVSAFRTALKGLQRKGIPASMLSEVAQMDPDAGTQVAKVLQGMDLKFLKATQGAIDNAGAEIGFLAYNAGRNASDNANRLMDRVIKNGGTATQVTVHATLKLDGRDVYTAVQREARRRGVPAGAGRA